MVHSVNDLENDDVPDSESKAPEKEEIESRETKKEESKGKEIEKEEMESNKVNKSHELSLSSLKKDIVNDDGADDKIHAHNDSDNTGDELTKLETKIASRHNDCIDLPPSSDKKVNPQKSSGSNNQRRSRRRRHDKKDQLIRSNPKAKKPSRDIPPESLPSNLQLQDNIHLTHLNQNEHISTQSLPTNLQNGPLNLSTNSSPSISNNCVPNDERVGERERGQHQNGNTIGDTQLFVSTDQEVKITSLEELENEVEDKDMHQSMLTPAKTPTTTQAQDEPLRPPPAPDESPPLVTHDVSTIEVHEDWLTIAVESVKTDPVCQRWVIPYPPTILRTIEQPLSEIPFPNESPHSTKTSSVSSGDDFLT